MSERVNRVMRLLSPRRSNAAVPEPDDVLELPGRVFGEAEQHARSAVGVSVLPLDAPVELELVVEI